MNQTSLLFQEELYAIPAELEVVLCRSWDSYTPEEKELLGKILAGIGRTLASARIVVRETIDLVDINPSITSAVLVFGSEAPGINSYEVVQAQGFSLIRADDLPALDTERKKRLWASLRQMFGI